MLSIKDDGKEWERWRRRQKWRPKKAPQKFLKNSVTLVWGLRFYFWSVLLFGFILQPVTNKIIKNIFLKKYKIIFSTLFDLGFGFRFQLVTQDPILILILILALILILTLTSSTTNQTLIRFLIWSSWFLI